MLQRAALIVTTVALAGCAARSATPDASPAELRAEIDAVLDDFHRAAAESDADRYLDHFTDDGVFFGTDPEERWTKQQFEPYVRNAFANGGWAYLPQERNVFFSDDGVVAWFDEVIVSPRGTVVVRGTGVLERGDDDTWRIAQYNFSVPFPNSLWDTILRMIREDRERQ